MSTVSNNNLQVRTSKRQILSIAMPIAAAIAVPQINFVINNIFLGSLGERALGVAGIIGVYYLIFAVIGMGLNNGLQVLIARRAGEKNIEAIGDLFYQGSLISLVVAALGIIFTYCFVEPLHSCFLRDPENVSMLVAFLKIRIWGLPFLYLYQLRNAFLVGTNNTRLLIIGTIVETVVNIFLDYSLIYGKFGFPELGFNGAAYASVIAECMALIVIYLVIAKDSVGKGFNLFAYRTIDVALCKKILKQSAPLVLQYAVSLISWEYFYILVEHQGALPLAVSNAMRNIIGLFGCFTWAFAATSNTMVSNLIGQERSNEIISTVWKIAGLSASFALGSFIIVSLNGSVLLSFYGQGKEFMEMAIPVLNVVLVGLFITSFSTVWMNAVVGTGHTKVALVVELLAVLVYSVYNYIVIEYLHLSLLWAWASEWIYWVILFVPCVSYVCRMYKNT